MAAKVQTKIEKVTARAGIKRAFALLRQRGLSIRQFRADCGSYAEDIVQTVDDNSLLFYLRAADSQSMYAQIQRITEWKPAEINFQECEVASVMFSQFLEDRHSRLVVQLTQVEDEPQMQDLFGQKYIYRCILTNDWERTEQEIIILYNQHGARERDFDSLNNDFMWKHLPCSYLKENTVFMILMAICKNFASSSTPTASSRCCRPRRCSSTSASPSLSTTRTAST